LQTLTELRMLVFAGGTHLTDAALPHLLKLEKLESLTFHVGPGYLTAARLGDLGKLPRLRALGLAGSEWPGSQMVDALLKLEKLEFLSFIGHPGPIAASLPDLAKLPRLKTLCLGGDEWPGSETVDALAKLPHLRELYLDYPVTPGKEQPDVAALQAALPNCRIETDPQAWSEVYAEWVSELRGHAHAHVDPDRRAAEWVVSIGGKGLLKIGGQGQDLGFGPDSKLPEEPFHVTRVNLGENSRVTDAGLANLTGLSQLKFIQLEGTPTTDAGLAHLADLPSLRVLFLGRTAVSDAGMQHVGKLTGLLFLHLSGTKVTDRGLEHLAGLVNLVGLTLPDSTVGDDGLRCLEDLTELRVLGWDGMTDAGLRHLLKLENLEWLTLRFTRPGSTTAGLEHLAKLPRLKMLALFGPPWTGSNVVETLAKFPSLRELYYIAGADTPEPDVAALKKALPNCRVETRNEAHFAASSWLSRTLAYGDLPDSLPGPDRRAAEWVQSIGGKLGLMVDGESANVVPNDELPRTPFHVTLVQLAENAAVTDASLTNLAGLSDLAYLDLSHTPTTDAVLAYLTDLPSLWRLSLAGTPITDVGLGHVGKLKGLTSLSINSTKVTDRGLEHLVGLGNLRFLNLMGTSISDDGLRHLQGLTELRMLVLAGGTHITDAGLPHLLKLEKLENLCLTVRPGRVTAAGLADLAKLPRLKALCLAVTEWPGSQTVDALAKLPHLRELYLNYEEPDVAALRAALPNCRIEADPKAWNPAITRLHNEAPWYGQQPEAEAAGDIDPDRRAAEWVLEIGGLVRVLAEGRTREITSISDFNEMVSDTGGQFELTVVLLDHNPLVNDASLSNLHGLEGLKALYLAGTQVTDAGLEDIARFRQMGCLSLGGTKVTDAGLVHLRGMQELALLTLWNTRVKGAGLAQLVELPRLADLSIDSAQLPGSMEYLTRLPKLTALKVPDPGMDDGLLQRLTALKNLTELCLGTDAKVTDHGIAAFRSALPNCRITRVSEEIAEEYQLDQAVPAKPAAESAGDIDPDRRAAEWVLSIGGEMDLMVDGEHYGDPKGKLPQKPFHVTFVSLAENPYATDAGLANLAGLSQLHTLLLERTPITDAGLAHIANLQSLRLLNVQGTRVGDAGLGHVAKLKALTSLSLGNTKVTGRGLESLVGLGDLRALNIAGTTVADDDLRWLENLTELRMLCLNDTCVSDAGLQHLLKLGRLDVLTLRQGNALTMAGLRELERLPRLRALCLFGPWVGSGALETLTKSPHLRELYYFVDPGTPEPDVAALQRALPDCRVETRAEAWKPTYMRYFGKPAGEPDPLPAPDRRAAGVEGVPGANAQPSAGGGPSEAEGDAKPQEPASPEPAE
jgi:Leucine-rich repeat (LRR) protein